jgi:hypothetical protein
MLGSACKLSLCHSERSEESHFLGLCKAKSEILRRFAPQNDMQQDFAYTHQENQVATCNKLVFQHFSFLNPTPNQFNSMWHQRGGFFGKLS